MLATAYSTTAGRVHGKKWERAVAFTCLDPSDARHDLIAPCRATRRWRVCPLDRPHPARLGPGAMDAACTGPAPSPHHPAGVAGASRRQSRAAATWDGAAFRLMLNACSLAPLGLCPPPFFFPPHPAYCFHFGRRLAVEGVLLRFPPILGPRGRPPTHAALGCWLLGPRTHGGSSPELAEACTDAKTSDFAFSHPLKSERSDWSAS